MSDPAFELSARKVSGENCFSFSNFFYPSGAPPLVSPVVIPEALNRHMPAYLMAVFKKGERPVVGPSVSNNWQVDALNRAPAEGKNSYPKGFLVRSNAPVVEKPTGKHGGWTDSDVGFGNLLLEMDKAPWDAQLAFWTAAIAQGCPVVALTDSGGKSIHAIVRTGAGTQELHKTLSKAIIKSLAPLLVDTTTANPSRLTRLPGFVREETKRSQMLLYVNPAAPAWAHSGFQAKLEEWSAIAAAEIPQSVQQKARELHLREKEGLSDEQERKDFQKRREGLGIAFGIDMDTLVEDNGWVIDREKVKCGDREEERTYLNCPRSCHHTGGGDDDGDKDAYMFDRGTGALFPWGFHCSHDSCREMGMIDVLEEMHAADPEALKPYLKFSDVHDLFEDLTAGEKPAAGDEPAGHSNVWGIRKNSDAPVNSEVEMWSIFREYLTDRALFVVEWNEWVFWDGSRWSRDRLNCLKTEYQEFLGGRIKRAKSPEIEKANQKWATVKMRNAIVSMAESEKSMKVSASQFDQQPMLLGCKNGILDLETTEFRYARPGDMMSHHTGCAWNPEAKCPNFLGFLDKVTQGNREQQDFLQRFFGYCLTASTREQKMLIIQGPGSNGKTTLVEILTDVMGTYAWKAPSTLLMKTRNTNQGGPSPEVINLKGRRFCPTDECDIHQEVDEVKLKQITGGENMVGRDMYEKMQTFKSTAKTVMGCNHLPKVANNDDGIWRRIVLIIFGVSFKGSGQDLGFAGRLKLEMEGILVWLAQGTRMWVEDGLKPPADVDDRTREYREDQDLLGQFLADNAVFTEKHNERTKKSDLYERYKVFVSENNSRPMAHNVLSRLLKDRGGVSVKTGSVRFWDNISLKPSTDCEI